MRHRDDVQPVVEVLAEAPLAHRRAQVLVGGRDQPQVDLHGAPAQPLDLALLQHPQQLHLHVRGDLADLVQEQRAAVGLHEAAVVPLDRAR